MDTGTKPISRSTRRHVTGIALVRPLSLLAILILGGVLPVAIHRATAAREKAALGVFRQEAAAETAQAVQKLERAFAALHKRLRTIARLPAVRGIDRYATNLSDDARLTIQEIYNDLASTVAVSELYIVPVGMDPDRVDPVTGEPEEPITTFDELIIGRNADQGKEGGVTKGTATSVEEIEIYEYRLMKRQLMQMVERWPEESLVKWEEYPALTGPEVVTCDNSRYSPSHPDDRDRSGIVYSVPFYDRAGKLKGCVSAVMLSGAMRDLLPEADGVLEAESHGYEVQARECDVCGPGVRLVERLRNDRELLYARGTDLRTHDAGATWRLWTALPNMAFLEMPEMQAARAGARWGYGGSATLTLMLLAFRALLVSRWRMVRRKADELEARVRERTLQVEQARGAAEAASRAKSEFLANMSHEIRTPMTAILGYADMLLEEGDMRRAPERRIEAIHAMRRNSQHLLAIINDILDISKVEAGRMATERIRCSPARLAREVVSMLRPRATEKGLELHLRFEGSLPETIESDPTRIRQILVNLVGNAIKFTETGSVSVTLGLSPAPTPLLEMSVTDTGIGMTREQMDRVFEAFTQADTSTTRRFGGTGLGLAISRRLAELLGGGLEVRSVPGQGTTFLATLATGDLAGVRMVDGSTEALAEPEDHDRLQASPRLDARILVAEDGTDNQRLISMLLERAGAVVTLATNGRAAVDMALAYRTPGHPHYTGGRPFDLVLMDMQMPLLDGYAATSLLRSSGYTGPIVALTAHAMAEDRSKCLAVGCNDYATKPIDRRALLTTCERWVSAGRRAAA